MGRIKKPLPGKLILSAIYSTPEAIASAMEQMEKKFGHIEFETEEFEFTHTDYYQEEMGDRLKRKFFAFEKMVARDRLAEIKTWTNKLEAKYGDKVGDFVFRTVNLDPGILTLSGLVLASTKDFSHRIYLHDGIFAEITLIYKNKEFVSLPWTYPDYMEPKVIDFLAKVRETMKKMEFEK
jgi:hypothetical protein